MQTFEAVSPFAKKLTLEFRVQEESGNNQEREGLVSIRSECRDANAIEEVDQAESSC